MPPRDVRRYGTITLESGRVGAEFADAFNIAAYIQSINFPTDGPNLNILRVPGPFSNYPVPGRLQDMTFEVVLTASLQAFLGAWGTEQTVDVSEPLFTPGATARTMTTELTGILRSPRLGALNMGADEIRTMTCVYELLGYEVLISGQTHPVWDINLKTDTYNANGVSVFDRLVASS